MGQEEENKQTKKKRDDQQGKKGDITKLFLLLDVFEHIITNVVSRGYSREVAEPVLLRLWKEEFELNDVQQTTEIVIMDICKSQESNALHDSKQLQDNEVISDDDKLHKQQVMERLFKVVSIPSAVDVLNGLRKWFCVVPLTDVFFSFGYSSIARIIV